MSLTREARSLPSPDIIVSTHSQTNAMLSRWKAWGDITVPVHSVPTDFLAHRMRAQENIERYYAPTWRTT
ncbi:MAG: hypothetical protein HY319_20880 [Armatimonadetes bacterium]|nr:hypothetical protein [Armatimonadota bacterium]